MAHRTQRAATEVAPGKLQLDVIFQAPAGQKLDTRYGPSTRLLVRNEYPACHVHQQDWGVPVRLAEGGAGRLPLVLAGMGGGQTP